MKHYFTAFVVCYLFVGCSCRAAGEPVQVSMAALIATPERFDGKLIRVIGFMHLEFEGQCLYLHREDFEHAIIGNWVWLDVDIATHKAKNDNYVIIQGVFDAESRGHFGMSAGTIHSINRLDVWQQRREGNKPASPRAK